MSGRRKIGTVLYEKNVREGPDEKFRLCLEAIHEEESEKTCLTNLN